MENPSIQTHLVLLCCTKRLCIFGPKGAIQIHYYYYYYYYYPLRTVVSVMYLFNAYLVSKEIIINLKKLLNCAEIDCTGFVAEV